MILMILYLCELLSVRFIYSFKACYQKNSNYEVTEGKVNNGQAVAVEVKYSHTERGINKCYIFN